MTVARIVNNTSHTAFAKAASLGSIVSANSVNPTQGSLVLALRVFKVYLMRLDILPSRMLLEDALLYMAGQSGLLVGAVIALP
jgi:hypothetical protein